MRLRQGRRNKHNIYLQLGAEPSDQDKCLGFFVDPEWAGVFMSIVNGVPGVLTAVVNHMGLDTTKPPS